MSDGDDLERDDDFDDEIAPEGNRITGGRTAASLSERSTSVSRFARASFSSE